MLAWVDWHRGVRRMGWGHGKGRLGGWIGSGGDETSCDSAGQMLTLVPGPAIGLLGFAPMKSRVQIRVDPYDWMANNMG